MDEADLSVYIVEDDAAVRDSLSLLLSLRGYRTATFGSAEDFLAAFREAWRGCVIADIRMTGMDGLALQRALRERGVRIPFVLVTAHGSVAAAREAFRAEAVDFIEKPFDEEVVVRAVEAGFARERERVAREAVAARREASLASLSRREREVLDLIVLGMHNNEVAARLGISPRTVEVHRTRILAKVGARNMAELVRLAGPPP